MSNEVISIINWGLINQVPYTTRCNFRILQHHLQRCTVVHRWILNLKNMSFGILTVLSGSIGVAFMFEFLAPPLAPLPPLQPPRLSQLVSKVSSAKEAGLYHVGHYLSHKIEFRYQIYWMFKDFMNENNDIQRVRAIRTDLKVAFPFISSSTSEHE